MSSRLCLWSVAGLRLRFLRRSTPNRILDGDAGIAFPLSRHSLRARFAGLSGDARVLEDGRDTADRLADVRLILELGGNGIARGEGEQLGVVDVNLLADAGRGGGEGCDGDSGDLGDGEVELLVINRNAGFDGDRESDLRRERIAEVVLSV